MSTSPVPPRFVPTLTEVVQPALMHEPPATSEKAELPMALSVQLQDQMAQRVLQRVDLLLERRLREAVGQLILEHTQSLAPRLREEIEQVVRQTISQAFEQEVAQVPPRS